MTEEEKFLKEQEIAEQFEKVFQRANAEFPNPTLEEMDLLGEEMRFLLAQLPQEPVRTPYFKSLFDVAQKNLLEKNFENS